MRLNSLVKPLLITGFMLAGTAQAAPDAREVLEASPVDDIVAQYPEMMSRGIQDGLKQSGQVPPMVADSIGFLVSNSFRAADIEQRVVANLEAALTPEQLEEVNGWYQTPVAGKIGGGNRRVRTGSLAGDSQPGGRAEQTLPGYSPGKAV